MCSPLWRSDPLSVPQPLGLDVLSGIDVSYLFAGNGPPRAREAGTSRRANRCRATAACFASAASGERGLFRQRDLLAVDLGIRGRQRVEVGRR